MSQASLPTASANSPGFGYGTYLTGTPRRSAMARAMSGETPSGSPDGDFPVTSRKLLMLIAARRTPCGASSETTDWDIGLGSGTSEARALYLAALAACNLGPGRGTTGREPPRANAGGEPPGANHWGLAAFGPTHRKR